MSRSTAAQTSRAYAEIAQAASPETAEMLVDAVAKVPWDDLVTNDHLDARVADVDARFAQVDARFAEVLAEMKTRFAESDAKHERSMRSFAVWMVTAMFTFNGALAAWLTAIH